MKKKSSAKTKAQKKTVAKVTSRQKITSAQKKAVAKKKITTKISRKIKAIKRKVEKKAVKPAERARRAKGVSYTMPPRMEVPFALPEAEPILRAKEAVEVSKFTAVETPQETVRVEYNLPSRYSDNKIILMARDPWWLHTYWDISESRIGEVIDSIPLNEREGLHWVLRLHDVSGINDFNGDNSHHFYDTEINYDARNWYLNPNNPEREWCCEIGLKNSQGRFFMVARSNIVKSPYFGISSIVDEEWALPDEEYFKALGVYELGRSSFERKKRLEEFILSQISSGGFSPGISSITSAMGRKPAARKFFLEVWTELILYGRTEADAHVTVEGKKVAIRPDGTFSLRYALPEGDFQYRVQGTSADKIETRTITPAVKRFTKENKRKLRK